MYAKRIISALSEFQTQRIRFIASVAGTRPLYLIGGCVRDALLGIGPRDIDFMLEEGLESFLHELAEQWSEQFGLVPHIELSRFLTGKLFLPQSDGSCAAIDFSQARKESYQKPGSAPQVAPGTLDEDLLRRDFGINALAARITGDGLELIDRVDGIKDIEARQLRILHAKSFEDDPIRMIRGVRFRWRFALEFESSTAKAFEDAAEKNLLSLVSLRRRFEELRKVLEEERPLEMLEELQRSRLLYVLCPVLRNLDSASDIPGRDWNGKDWKERFLSLVNVDEMEFRKYLLELGVSKQLRQELLAGRVGA